MSIGKGYFGKLILTTCLVGIIMIGDHLELHFGELDAKGILENLSVDYEKILSERGKELIKTVRENFPD